MLWQDCLCNMEDGILQENGIKVQHEPAYVFPISTEAKLPCNNGVNNSRKQKNQASSADLFSTWTYFQVAKSVEEGCCKFNIRPLHESMLVLAPESTYGVGLPYVAIQLGPLNWSVKPQDTDK